jgi:hypothetical protein
MIPLIPLIPLIRWIRLAPGRFCLAGARPGV